MADFQSGYMDMLSGGSPEEAERARRIRSLIEQEEAERRREEQERLARLASLTDPNAAYDPPVAGPGMRMNSGSPRTDARLGLAQRNIASLNSHPSLMDVEAARPTAEERERYDYGMIGRRAGQPNISTAIPGGSVPEQPMESVEDRFAQTVGNDVGRLLHVRPTNRAGWDAVGPNQDYRDRREGVLADRASNRAEYFANRADMNRDFSYMDRLRGLDPDVARQLVESTGSRHVAAQDAEAQQAALERAEQQADKNLASEERLSKLELAATMMQSTDPQVRREGMALYQSAMSGGGATAGSGVDAPVAEKTLEELAAEDAVTQANTAILQGSEDVRRAALAQLLAKDPQSLTAEDVRGWTEDMVGEEMARLKSDPNATPEDVWKLQMISALLSENEQLRRGLVAAGPAEVLPWSTPAGRRVAPTRTYAGF